MYSFLVIFAAVVHIGYANDCQLPPVSGACPSNDTKTEPRFYYSAQNLKCAEFPYSGCGGNANNFKSEADCNAACKVKFSEAPAVSKIIAANKASQCWYKDQTFKHGDSIPRASEDNACSQGCFCNNFPEGDTPSITCAQVDCAPFPRDPPNCVATYTQKNCCPEYVCPNSTAEAKNTFKCTYGGKDYIEGQRIYDENYPCISCSCNRNFTGKLTTEGGLCREVNCGLTLRYQGHLVADCTPGFYNNSAGKTSCCPIEWDCPNKSK